MPPRRSRRSEALFVAGALSLASCGGRTLKTRDEPPVAEADAGVHGVPVDPISAIPSPIDVAQSGDSVTTLRTPLPAEAVEGIVRRLFEAFHARDTDAMEADVDATVVDLLAEPNAKTRYYFVGDLANRIKSAPYDQLDVDQMYRSQDVEIYAREELDQPGRPQRPTGMGADDLLVRIPIVTPRLGADYLFGEEIKLLLRRDGTRYLIHGYGENLPK